jgi:hypothetical protein
MLDKHGGSIGVLFFAIVVLGIAILGSLQTVDKREQELIQQNAAQRIEIDLLRADVDRLEKDLDRFAPRRRAPEPEQP